MRNPADPGAPAGVCGLHEWDLRTGTVTTTDMSKFGLEIYDVVSLAHAMGDERLERHCT